jgi:hypothetical protein
MHYKTEIERLPGESLASMADRLEEEAALLKFRAGMLRHYAKKVDLQDPEPEPVPHPDDGLPDPGNGRPCPPDTRGGCPPADPRPIPDPTPHPGGPVLV